MHFASTGLGRQPRFRYQPCHLLGARQVSFPESIFSSATGDNDSPGVQGRCGG